MDVLALRIAENLRALRRSRDVSQRRLAELADVPRATLAHLESGAANPTLSLLLKVAEALSVSLQSLIDVPPLRFAHLTAVDVPRRRRKGIEIKTLLVEPQPGHRFERLVLDVGSRFRWSPAPSQGRVRGGSCHMVCESGAVKVRAGAEQSTLASGDVVAFDAQCELVLSNLGTKQAVVYLLGLPTKLSFS